MYMVVIYPIKYNGDDEDEDDVILINANRKLQSIHLQINYSNKRRKYALYLILIVHYTY